jgi:hypothetical protein
MNTAPCSFRVNNPQNYYHFITEVLLGLHQELRALGPLDRQNTVLYYSGPFGKLLHPYTARIGPESEAPNGTQNARTGKGLSSPDMKEMADRILTHYGVVDDECECQTITLLWRSRCRRLSNLPSIKCALEAFGLPVIIVAAENMDFRKLLLLCRKTRLMVGAHGSGLANLIFMRAGSSLLELNPYGFYRDFFHKLGSTFGISTQELEGIAPAKYGRPYPRDFGLKKTDGPWTREEYAEIKNKHPKDAKIVRMMIRDVQEFAVDMNAFETLVTRTMHA